MTDQVGGSHPSFQSVSEIIQAAFWIVSSESIINCVEVSRPSVFPSPVRLGCRFCSVSARDQLPILQDALLMPIFPGGTQRDFERIRQRTVRIPLHQKT